MTAHVSDDRLIAICVADPPLAAERAHLAACGECRRRRQSVAGVLDDVERAASLEADSAFPAERLARLHARILQQLDRDGRPAQVIAFPAASRWAMPFARPRPLARWVAAAAAAGLVVGLLTGQIVSQLTGRQPSAAGARPDAGEPPGRTGLRAVSGPASDDEFLQEIEAAVLGAGPAALRPLDQMTPRAWETAR
jgi:hypothetical protein